MKTRPCPLTPEQLERAIAQHIAARDSNGSVSARWDRTEILNRGWFGYRTPGAVTDEAPWGVK